MPTPEDIARLVARDLYFAAGGTGEQWATLDRAPQIATAYAGQRQIASFTVTDIATGERFTVAISPA